MNDSLPARWARQVIATLVAKGVRVFFVSPGARSAPLVLALAEARERGEIRIFSHYDERGLAFAAVGFSHAQGTPCACVTTSGSAVANLLPACVEAFHSGVPVIFLTADRPPELRNTGANQTIRQPGIFGLHVQNSADIPPPCEKLLPTVGGWISRMLQPLESGWPGPVHLNVPFREPLLPKVENPPPLEACPTAVMEIQENQDKGASFSEAISWFEKRHRGLIVVGELSHKEQKHWPEILRLAGHLGWPVAADSLSGGKGLGQVLNHLDFLLQLDSCPKAECILHLGGRIVLRRVQELLAGYEGGEILQVRRGPEVLCAPGQQPKCFLGLLREFCGRVEEGIPASWSDEWRRDWEVLDQAVEKKLSEILDSTEELSNLSEPGLARWVSRYASATGALLFLGNSMPVRDFDAMVGGLPQGLCVIGQRGASGIDGNIAHVAGFARASGRRVIAMLGDLAVLHDLNSMALLRDLPVTLIVPNNGGGGIFEFLPMDIPQNVREEFLETPHQLDFSAASSQFGIPYTRTQSSLVAEAFLLNRQGPALIEVPSNRRANCEKHREIFRSVLASLE